MAEKPDGGSAFPWDAGDPRDGSSGMSLRDYFAAQALANIVGNEGGDFSVHAIASDCYRIADAMIAERKK